MAQTNPGQAPQPLRKIASGGEIKGDTTTLEDLSVIAKLSQTED